MASFSSQDALHAIMGADANQRIEAAENEIEANNRAMAQALASATDACLLEALRAARADEVTPASWLTIQAMEQEVSRRGLNVVPFRKE